MRLLIDFSVATGLALLFLLLSWVYGRVLSGGGRLNVFKRRLLTYGFVFALGMMYLMLAVSDLRLPRDLLFPLIASWGALVGVLAWWRLRHGRPRKAQLGDRS